jgi:hypothetical protein
MEKHFQTPDMQAIRQQREEATAAANVGVFAVPLGAPLPPVIPAVPVTPERPKYYTDVTEYLSRK